MATLWIYPSSYPSIHPSTHSSINSSIHASIQSSNATLIQKVYARIFAPLYYKTHLRWTCQSSVINMILFFLWFWINMLLYVKESSPLGLVPLGTVRKSRSRKWSFIELKGDGVVPDSPFSNQKWFTILALSIQLKVTAKPCFAQLLVVFTGKQINFSLPALLQLISLINSSTFLRRKSWISEVILVHPWPVIPDFFRTLDTSSLTCQLDVNFAPTSNTELSNIANNIIMKSCILDPLSSTLLNQHLDFFLPINLKIVNLSLESGHFPSLKSAVLSPLLKKANLHHEVLANYKPISNLKVISKIIEKVVAVRLQKYLEANQLNEPLQSAYKPFHSCETALVRVHNDILVAINKSHYVMLLLLDLSAAFDTDRSQSLAVYLKVLSLDRFCMNSTQLH